MNDDLNYFLSFLNNYFCSNIYDTTSFLKSNTASGKGKQITFHFIFVKVFIYKFVFALIKIEKKNSIAFSFQSMIDSQWSWLLMMVINLLRKGFGSIYTYYEILYSYSSLRIEFLSKSESSNRDFIDFIYEYLGRGIYLNIWCGISYQFTLKSFFGQIHPSHIIT